MGKEIRKMSWLVPKTSWKTTEAAGAKIWINKKGEFHRENGPAIVSPVGYREWYINGELHRENGPAVEFDDGHKQWWINNKLHREDGPAIEDPDNRDQWYLNGKRYCKSVWKAAVKDLKTNE